MDKGPEQSFPKEDRGGGEAPVISLSKHCCLLTRPRNEHLEPGHRCHSQELQSSVIGLGI